MKLEELTKLGVTEEQAKEILKINEKEVSDEKVKTTDAESKLTAANTAIKEMSEKAKAFDGVDVKKLQEDFKTLQSKYDTDLSAVKTSSAIELELAKSKAKDNRLIMPLLDKELIKLDKDGNLVGLKEQLDKVKTDYSYLFEVESKPDENDTGMTGDSGMDHTDGGLDNMDMFSKAAMEAAGLPSADIKTETK